MIYRLLGELVIGCERPLSLPGGHSLAVLAALLINANQRMSKTDLLTAAWGTDEVSEAQLHKAISDARGLLKQIGRRDDLVTYARHGYEIKVGDDDLDMLLFRRRLRQAEQARSQRRTDEEIGLLRQALGLWRGQHPLSNVPSNAFGKEAEGLEQRRKLAAVRLFDVELTRGGYYRVLDDLTLMAGYFPGDGRLAEQLMVAAYRCGHVTDATTAFERHAVALAEQTGGEPESALRDLYYAIAIGNDKTVTAAEAAIARRSGVPDGAEAVRVLEPAVPRQLPPEPADLVGRDDLVAEASWLLGRPPGRVPPVVVISGQGGIGKSALARRVAHAVREHYPDGQLYMELRGTSDAPARPAEVLAQFLRSFGVPVVPDSQAERIATYRTLLAERRVLVLLDDAADGAQVHGLIPASPGCAVLITARQRLPDIDGAHHVPPLGPLNRADATELFLRVARDARIDLAAERDAVDKVVALCGGLPLALRIAGALRVRDHPRPTAELADRLASQGPEAFTYGELSVARTIGAGYDRLDDGAKRLFLRLGLLAMPRYGLWTAAALHAGTGLDDVTALSQLAASSMIEQAEPGLRYRFHDLTRDYADRRARAEYPGRDYQTAVLAAAYGALLTLTRRAHVRVCGGDFEVVHSGVLAWEAPQAALDEVDADPTAWFEAERLNIRAAVTHCAELGLTEICWDLAVSAHELCNLGGYFDDWRATHLVALGACRAAADRRGEGIVLACLGQPALAATGWEGVPGIAELERSVELLASVGDQHGQAIAHRTLGNALRRRGYLTRPLELFKEALAGYEESTDTVGRSQTLRFIGQTYLDRGDPAAALEAFSRARAVADELGQQHVLAQVSYWTGQAHLAADHLADAAKAFQVMIDVHGQQAGIGHAYAAHGLGEVALRTGRLADAQRWLDLAARLAVDGLDGGLEGLVSLTAAELHHVLQQPAERLSALEHAADCFAGGGAAYLEARALAALAQADEDTRDREAARSAWSRVEDLYQEMGVPEEDRRHHRTLLGK